MNLRKILQLVIVLFILSVGMNERQVAANEFTNSLYYKIMFEKFVNGDEKVANEGVLSFNLPHLRPYQLYGILKHKSQDNESEQASDTQEEQPEEAKNSEPIVEFDSHISLVPLIYMYTDTLTPEARRMMIRHDQQIVLYFHDYAIEGNTLYIHSQLTNYMQEPVTITFSNINDSVRVFTEILYKDIDVPERKLDEPLHPQAKHYQGLHYLDKVVQLKHMNGRNNSFEFEVKPGATVKFVTTTDIPANTQYVPLYTTLQMSNGTKDEYTLHYKVDEPAPMDNNHFYYKIDF